jgi:hypothetical protein
MLLAYFDHLTETDMPELGAVAALVAPDRG